MSQRGIIQTGQSPVLQYSKMKEFDNSEDLYFHKRFLPHIQPRGAILFVNYRLAFSLPKAIIEELKSGKEEFEKKISKLSDKLKMLNRYNFYKKQFDILDNFLNKYKKSPQWLAIDKIADIVQDSIFWGDEKEYELICFCIMPNHVHTLIKPLLNSNNKSYPLSEIMRKHKSFTANQANGILSRTGSFWAKGYYDYYIRSKNGLHRIIFYILNNPVKAGLVKDYKDWKHLWVKDKYLNM